MLYSSIPQSFSDPLQGFGIFGRGIFSSERKSRNNRHHCASDSLVLGNIGKSL